ncbi:MAG: hypothetical protein KDC52_13445 [Ignavibacteriae bacterium]|nr:hypothetical protein [Ignavibacteriota bacterium]
MLFYVWFDEQASQLRLNLISAEHTIPPFGAEVKHAPLQEIISDFLTSEHLEGIPLTESSQNESDFINTESSKYILKVYMLII